MNRIKNYWNVSLLMRNTQGFDNKSRKYFCSFAEYNFLVSYLIMLERPPHSSCYDLALLHNLGKVYAGFTPENMRRAGYAYKNEVSASNKIGRDLGVGNVYYIFERMWKPKDGPEKFVTLAQQDVSIFFLRSFKQGVIGEYFAKQTEDKVSTAAKAYASLLFSYVYTSFYQSQPFAVLPVTYDNKTSVLEMLIAKHIFTLSEGILPIKSRILDEFEKKRTPVARFANDIYDLSQVFLPEDKKEVILRAENCLKSGRFVDDIAIKMLKSVTKW